MSETLVPGTIHCNCPLDASFPSLAYVCAALEAGCSGKIVEWIISNGAFKAKRLRRCSLRRSALCVSLVNKCTTNPRPDQLEGRYHGESTLDFFIRATLGNMQHILDQPSRPYSTKISSELGCRLSLSITSFQCLQPSPPWRLFTASYRLPARYSCPCKCMRPSKACDNIGTVKMSGHSQI